MKKLSPEEIEVIRSAAAKKGLRTDRKIAEAIGMSYQTYSRKINGHSDFTLKEVVAISKTLGLSNNQVATIFLPR